MNCKYCSFLFNHKGKQTEKWVCPCGVTYLCSRECLVNWILCGNNYRHNCVSKSQLREFCQQYIIDQKLMSDNYKTFQIFIYVDDIEDKTYCTSYITEVPKNKYDFQIICHEFGFNYHQINITNNMKMKVN